MNIRRCAVVFVEPREDVSFDLEGLLGGSPGLLRRRRWLAIAPHLDAEVELDEDGLELLGLLGPEAWVDRDGLPERLREPADRLLAAGLLIAEHATGEHYRNDAAARTGRWWPLSAVVHRHGRWRGIDGVQGMHEAGIATAAGLRERFGPPPVQAAGRVEAGRRIGLPRSEGDDFERLLARRATCRNFDRRPVAHDVFARMLQRVFAASSQVRVGEDTVFLKKTSPSGGGLHATGAYLVVQNVVGVAPGLYHYHPVDHALEPLPSPELPLEAFAKLALAGQHWFANAPVLVALTPRFARSFWKYRYHAKAYRALILDSGHLSQTLYLSATEMGLGAFVTSAINEIDIEQAFGMDPLEESPLAICGFGWRAQRMETAEFDPGGEVWEAEG